jgi:hypothetical protein
VFLRHFTSFGFSCKTIETFNEFCNLQSRPIMAVSELDLEMEQIKFKSMKAKFKVAVCRLRSPNEVRSEAGIDIMVSRHIKRDSLRNLVEQLLKSGTTVQSETRNIPFVILIGALTIRIPNIGKDEPLEILMAEDNLIVCVRSDDC